MKNLSNLLILLVAILLSGCQSKNSKTQVSVIENSDLTAQLDRYFNALLELKEFNGVVLVEKEGEVILKKAYNLTTDIDSSLHVTTAHQFDLRSISKLIAKYEIIKLEAEGTLSVDDPISVFLGEFPNSNKITLKHLLANQSGYPRDFDNEEDMNLFELEPQEIVEHIKKEPLEFIPGTETRYSNLGFQLVYFIIGQVTSQSFAQHIQEEVYDPLQMNSSGAHFYTDRNTLKNFATYHVEDNDQIISIPHHVKGSKRQAKLFSTAADLNKLLNAFKQAPYYKKMAGPSGTIGHSGGSDGIRSHIQTNIPKGYSFVFLANYDEIPFADIIKTIELIMEEKPYKIPVQLNRKSIVLSEKQIEKYIGRYDFKDAGHIIIDIKIEDGGLAAYQKGELVGPLHPENDSLFFWAPDDRQSMEFKLDANGEYKLIMDMFGAPWEGTKME